MTRGYRNNNPGNIRLNPLIQWEGEIKGTDTSFVTFKNMTYGIRALMKLLSNYKKRNYNTIELILNRYAPANENNTTGYIQKVSTYTGIPKNQNLVLDQMQMVKLARAIVKVEIGTDSNLIAVETYLNAYVLLKDPGIGEAYLKVREIWNSILNYWYILILIPVALWYVTRKR
jgi:hypothetical protein